eukprot:scaffold758_cov123-Isochrysis_galbana.AAC.4
MLGGPLLDHSVWLAAVPSSVRDRPCLIPIPDGCLRGACVAAGVCVAKAEQLNRDEAAGHVVEGQKGPAAVRHVCVPYVLDAKVRIREEAPDRAARKLRVLESGTNSGLPVLEPAGRVGEDCPRRLVTGFNGILHGEDLLAVLVLLLFASLCKVNWHLTE